jgi:hypothetical protein
MDLLSNRALTEIGDTVDLVAERTGERPVLDPPPDGDARTSALAAGDTLGVFRLSRPACATASHAARRGRDDRGRGPHPSGPAGSGGGAYVKRARGLEALSAPVSSPCWPSFGVLL